MCVIGASLFRSSIVVFFCNMFLLLLLFNCLSTDHINHYRHINHVRKYKCFRFVAYGEHTVVKQVLNLSEKQLRNKVVSERDFNLLSSVQRAIPFLVILS